MSVRSIHRASGTGGLRAFNAHKVDIVSDSADSDKIKYKDSGGTVRTLTTSTDVNPFSGVDGAINYVEVTVSSAELLALNATPKTLVAAPAAGIVQVPVMVAVIKPAGTAYAGIAVGEDLAVRYTDGSGTIGLTVETTGFLDQATDQVRWGAIDAAAAAAITPVAAAALVLHMTAGEITTGNSPLRVKLWYSKFSTGL